MKKCIENCFSGHNADDLHLENEVDSEAFEIYKKNSETDTHNEKLDENNGSLSENVEFEMKNQQQDLRLMDVYLEMNRLSMLNKLSELLNASQNLDLEDDSKWIREDELGLLGLNTVIKYDLPDFSKVFNFECSKVMYYDSDE